MADVQQATDYVIASEDDPGNRGVITCIAGDDGGMTRLGLTKLYHPQLAAQGFYDGMPMTGRPSYLTPTTVPYARALPMAEASYASQYATPLYLDQIEAQAICTAMLSFAVLEGNHEAIKLLQAALEQCGHSGIVEDGTIGPLTVQAVNACDPAKLLDQWIVEELAYFASLAATTASQRKFVAGWDNRANHLRMLLA